MLLTEYDEKKTMRLFRKEAREEGIQEGIQKEQHRLIHVMLQKGMSIEQICELTELPLEEISQVLREEQASHR